MNRTPFLCPSARRPMQALLLSASAIAVAAPAMAAEVVFATERGFEAETGRRTSQTSGLTQIRLDSGAILSFVDAADYRLNTDGSVDLYAGSVTVAGADGTETVIRMPDGVEGRVGGGAAASFSVTADGGSRGHSLTGDVTIVRAGNARVFEAGEMWAANDDGLRQVVSNGVQQAPVATADEPQVAAMDEGGPAAAAANGIPVSLPDALAFAGASSDVVLAARNVQSAVENPAVDAFPTGDLALLVSYAAQLETPYGGAAFPGAQADIVRVYLGYLANGGAGADFLAAYATFLTQYLDLIRAGALPSSFAGTDPADVRAFIEFTGRTSGFGSLSSQNRALVEAYLQFLASGGNPDLFARSYTDLVGAYFTYLRGGGDPLAFQGASQQTLAAYIGFLAQSGLAAQLSAADRALLEAYLANGGLAFTSQYRTALEAYFSYLQAGNLPSGYVGLDGETLRSYLEALQSTGLFDDVLGSRAEFYAAFLAHLRGGGAPDAFAGLNANVFAGYAAQLSAYYEFLLQGGQPSGYTALTQQQIAAYLSALQGAGASAVFLDDLAAFYAGYFAYLSEGGNPDLYTGLPSLNLPGFADALNAYAAFLSGGGLPSGYTAVDRATLAQYLDALARSGQLADLLGANADWVQAYFAYLANGGDADRYAALPVYANYVSALQAYYAFLGAGGLPADYTALTPSQIQAYLAALAAAGGISAQLGDLASFYTGYYAFIAAGGNPANFAGLPVYADYTAALQAYYAFLAGGGLPADYTALTPAQVRAYLAALSSAGGLSSQLGELADFYTSYYAFVAGGGNPANFAGLPVYADYTAALQAYYAFLAAGGLPADYTALTQSQIQSYLAALSAAGGLSSRLGDLASFYSSYYAFIAGGGNPAEFAGLPVYATWLGALEAYYAYLGAGGRPSAYTALTQAQIRAYIEALNGAGVLQAELTPEARDFILAYLAYVQSGAQPDDFGELPANNQGPTLLAGANVWIFSNEGGRVGTAPTADVSDDGQIRSVGYATAPNNAVTFEYTGAGNALKEYGRVGEAVAWTRYDRGTSGGVSNQNVHLLLGTPAVNLPASGLIDYQLIGGTAPTNAMAPAGEIGAFTGDLAVAFGTTPRVGLNFDVHVGTRGWRAQTPGGAAGAATGGLFVGSDMRFQTQDLGRSNLAGNACAGYCIVQVFGGLFGNGAGSAGFEYHIDDQSSGGRSYINGTAVFGTTGTELAQIGTMPSAPGPTPTNVDHPANYAYAGGFATGAPATVMAHYAGYSGTDRKLVTLDTDGTLLSAADNFYQPSGGDSVDVQGDALGLLGRFTGGNLTLFGSRGFNGLAANTGAHWVVLAPSSGTVPASGTIEYDLLAATRPTFTNGATAAGSFDGSLTLAFGAPMIEGTIAGDILMSESGGDRVYSFDHDFSASAATLAQGLFTYDYQGLRGTGLACPTAGDCSVNISIVTGGTNGADRVGVTYETWGGFGAPRITGAALFGAPGTWPATGGSGGGTGDPGVPDEVPTPLTGYAGGFDPQTASINMQIAGRIGSNTYVFGESGFTASPYTLNPAGGLTSYTRQPGGTPVRTNGSAAIADVYGNADALIGRWTGGTTTGGNPFILVPNNGAHYVLMRPPTDAFTMPTSGRIDYYLIAATQPTLADGSMGPGTFAGDMAVLFGPTVKVAMEGQITMPSFNYTFSTAGGIANAQDSTTSLNLAVSTPGYFNFNVDGDDGSGNCAASACLMTVSGSFTGNDTDTIGLSYAAYRPVAATSIAGTAIFGAGPERSGAGGAAPTPAVATGSYDNQRLIHMAYGGFDTQYRSTVTYDETGAITAWTRDNGSANGGPAGPADERGSVAGAIGWARWLDNNNFATNDPKLANTGRHLVSGQVATNMPASGTVSYELIGQTRPTDRTGNLAPGSLEGTLAVDFATSRVGVDLDVAIGDRGWNLKTEGGSANPANGGFAITASNSFAGGATITGTTAASCTGSCSSNIEGALFGPGASHVGLGYSIVDGSLVVSGVGAFGRP